jgi:uncharacterized membrane protein
MFPVIANDMSDYIKLLERKLYSYKKYTQNYRNEQLRTFFLHACVMVWVSFLGGYCILANKIK